MQKPRASTGLLASDRVVFDGAFLAHLSDRGLAPKSIQRIRWAVRHAARWLARRKQSLLKLRRGALPAMLTASTPASWSWWAQKDYKSGLASWFRFRSPDAERTKPTYVWQHWIDDFIQFLETQSGLAPSTRRAYADLLRGYLHWQFGDAAADWQRVGPPDIWSYTHAFQRGRKPGTLNHELCRLRRFFKFLHMRGVCSTELSQAVPRFFNFGQSTHTEPLTDRQRCALLCSFNRRTALGARNYCLALCMVDLGLRPSEVVGLALTDVDWKEQVLTIHPIKTARGRQLPLIDRIVAALRDYVQNHRPATNCERLFVRHDERRVGTVMDFRAVGYAMEAAYRRCKFPGRWLGSYRLRHTFATRLHARGADLKQIADLLGHQHLQTTTIYAKVDTTGLRALALPWPLNHEAVITTR